MLGSSKKQQHRGLLGSSVLKLLCKGCLKGGEKMSKKSNKRKRNNKPISKDKKALLLISVLNFTTTVLNLITTVLRIILSF